ncbi:acyl carrier protein [Chitinophaga nivalis]|uniref:Acyl carrier protein n=1 Tax=Chitinophaga nivalis TaxID=2991709 RepID=A0ABT3IW79_9BACT|nr:acyl carrier protein [Chitinophaga nivalis]MCW3462057.1 acyl carrier protein [Chitinophaga nivalis]MCW3488251.1 acyl carrier protein [Chitinophaga nivalis]
MTAIAERLQRLISDHNLGNGNPINEDALLYEDLGLDPLDCIDLIMMMETTLERNIALDGVDDLKTFNALVRFITAQ